MSKLLIVALTGISLLTSYSASSAAEMAAGKGFVYCISGELDSFNPQLSSAGLNVETLATQLYNRLLTVDPLTYRLIPELAEKWQVTGKGQRITFYLRRDVAFQSPGWFTPHRNLNANDVVYSFSRMLDKKHPWHQVGGGSYPYFDSLKLSDNVQSIHKISDYVVEFKLKQPDAAFLWHIATNYAPILSAEYAQKLEKNSQQQLMDTYPVGTGPFMLAGYRAGQFIRLLRNPVYWKGQPNPQQIVIDIGTGGTGRLSKLLTGECDILAYPAASQLTVLRDDPRLRMSLRPGMNTAYLAFNTSKPPLNNPQVRHALALAIDNERVMNSIYYGTAETAASILPRASWAYDAIAKVTSYSPDKARARLKQLGIEGLHLQMMVPIRAQPWDPSPLKMAELLQADLGRAGVQVDIIPVEGRNIENKLMNNNHDLSLTGWATDSNDPDSFFRPILSCAAIDSQTNYSHWCNPQFDALLESALRSQQLSERVDDYHQAQRLLAEELPVLPLASSLQLLAYRSDIRGLVLSPFGNASLAGVSRDGDKGN